ncbi:MAG: efflux RND transporter periplasmic adaptor subunit [Saprospiraceae bacterium]|jgi:membrane fusion protein (multidrug efflux system)|nr:efflux RND transporter periplasmic adaptor subunit [Saprospiraceae bacterium]MBP9195392.1 efflux RND transporter periplasmic adaptor subunit [Saprospiraceae bacterium]
MRSLWIVGAVIALMVLAKIFLFPAKEEQKSGPGGPGGGKGKGGTMPVDIYLAKKQENAQEIFASGTMVANEEVELHPEMSGRIVKLNISEGNLVQKGQLIAKIYDADIMARLKKNKYEAELAAQVEARQKKLLDINAISKEEYDLALNKVNTLGADRESLEVALAQTEVRAPFTGRIGLKAISVGAYVTPATTIATLVQTNPIRMDFSVPEKYAGNVNKGSKISFGLDGSAHKFDGTVTAIDPKIDEALRTLKIRATVANAAEKFRPGMFVKVNVKLGSTQSILVPSETLIPFIGGKKIYVMKGGKAVEQNVVTGLRTSDKVEILEGINVGDSIVASGIMALKDGQSVKAKKVLNP